MFSKVFFLRVAKSQDCVGKEFREEKMLKTSTLFFSDNVSKSLLFCKRLVGKPIDSTCIQLITDSKPCASFVDLHWLN